MLVSAFSSNEVFGEPVGVGGRATIGVQSLCDKMCFETIAEVEIA